MPFFISVSFKRYIFFRFLPCFLINTLVIAVLTKDYPINLSYSTGAISLFIQSLATDGMAIYDLLTKSKRVKIYFNFSFQVVIHLITIILLVGIGVASGYASKLSFFRALTPSPQGLIDNIWSALIAVLLVEYLRLAYSGSNIGIQEIFIRSQKSIGANILNYIRDKSIEQNANPILVQAICIVENIQRPKWIRVFEDIKSWLRLVGTYGIMQVKSNHPISDKESIDIALREHLKNTLKIKNIDNLKKHIEIYNSSEEYKELVIQAMFYLDPYSTEY